MKKIVLAWKKSSSITGTIGNWVKILNTGIDEEAKKYWDAAAGVKEFSTPFQIIRFRRYADIDSRILDYGCGYGRTLNELKNDGYFRLTGIDFSEKMIERGHEKYPGLELIVNQGKDIPFQDDTFDAVLLLSVFTCIYRDEAQDRIIGEVKRVLKPDGIIYINDYLINADARNLQRYDRFKDMYGHYGIFELQEESGVTILRHHSKDRIMKLIGSFKQLAFEQLAYTTMNGNRSNGFYYIGKNLK